MTDAEAHRRLLALIKANADPSDTLFGCFGPDDLAALRHAAAQLGTTESP